MGLYKDQYAGYADHPKYGKQPRMTGSNPGSDYKGDVHLHWHSGKDCRVPDTAIPANLKKQTPATIPVTHYYDVRRVCEDCGERFLFFALEQKHWYEELGFPLDSDCVRCVACRKRQQGIAQARQRYEELFPIELRTAEENLEMAERCVDLIDDGAFTVKRLGRVRMLLRLVEEKEYEQERCMLLRSRLSRLEDDTP